MKQNRYGKGNGRVMRQLTHNNRIRRQMARFSTAIDRHFDDCNPAYSLNECWNDFLTMKYLAAQLPKGDVANKYLDHAEAIILEIKSNGG